MLLFFFQLSPISIFHNSNRTVNRFGDKKQKERKQNNEKRNQNKQAHESRSH